VIIYISLRKNPILSGERLVDAQTSFGQYGEPVVSFMFDSIGARIFGEFTSKNVGQRLAIVFDDKVLSSPAINTAILGGSGIIQGNFTIQSATELALMMRSGALPAKLDILEEKIIGPGLGRGVY
jgi:preprotein translocase subunit SecD